MFSLKIPDFLDVFVLSYNYSISNHPDIFFIRIAKFGIWIIDLGIQSFIELFDGLAACAHLSNQRVI